MIQLRMWFRVIRLVHSVVRNLKKLELRGDAT